MQKRTLNRCVAVLLSTLVVLGGLATATGRQTSGSQRRFPSLPAHALYPGEEKDYEIASRFAPVFYQGLGESPRFDYITNFDFDSDWKGDNNWVHAADTQYKLKGYVYYALSETGTHYFLHYACFHPRDYKGGAKKGAILSELMREGVKLGGKYDPTGLSDEAVLAHENDLEGCLVVVAKNGGGRTVMVETLAHNRFIKFVPEGSSAGGFESVKLDGERPELFAEPKGHGIRAYTGDPKQTKDAVHGVRKYIYTGHADNPEKGNTGPVGYELVPMYATLWAHARGGVNETYGEAHSYGAIAINAILEENGGIDRQTRMGSYGSAFRGGVGAANMARPPWGWFDDAEKDRPLGEWFFDPAGTIQRHFNRGERFSTIYVHQPFLGVFRR